MLLDFLKGVKDFRRKQGQQFEIGYVLYFSTLAILSGAHSYRKIYQFIKKHYKKFNKKYSLNWKKPPSYNTIRNLIINVDSSSLELIFRRHSKKLSKDILEEKKDLHLSFDGKVVRGSFDHFEDEKAIQILSIFCSLNDIIMAHEIINCKTNEIPVVQKLIPNLDFELAIYTCDALNCQEGTIKSVIDSGGNLIVQVKKNQKYLLNKCEKIGQKNKYIEKYVTDIEKGHGRIEIRTCTIFEVENIIHNGKWKDVKTIIKVERDIKVFDTKKKKWKDRHEISYYIATNRLSAKKYNIIIREHWGIENKNHNVRDCAMKEDSSRIRKNPQNMAILRSFALNLMRYNGVKNIEEELYSNVLNINRLLRYNGIKNN